MKPPDWKQCTEEELWKYVAWHLEGAGISSVLVGGAVVAIYTEGLYQSGDLDMVPDDLQRKRLEAVLGEIGFVPSKSRYFRHPECRHLYLEFPKGPVEIGDEFPIEPAEMEVDGRRLKILSPTDCVKDRLASFIYWGSRDTFDQAVLVCRSQGAAVNLKAVRQWCEAEGKREVFEEMAKALG
ncbi:hypothetical protein [Haloferula sp. BvORR071]|uniref:hypothetical protein n=1 Tax=Haloferula sp. BvORR071 TaxID=1396141 RepID=UPI00054CF13E|nr:hypothetical protein [Haloferula sp. BvORR071]